MKDEEAQPTHRMCIRFNTWYARGPVFDRQSRGNKLRSSPSSLRGGMVKRDRGQQGKHE